jgi:hypothetical protein
MFHKCVGKHLKELVSCLQTIVIIIVSPITLLPFGSWHDCFPPIHIGKIACNALFLARTSMLIDICFCLHIASVVYFRIEQVPVVSNCPPYYGVL